MMPLLADSQPDRGSGCNRLFVPHARQLQDGKWRLNQTSWVIQADPSNTSLIACSPTLTVRTLVALPRHQNVAHQYLDIPARDVHWVQ